MQLARTTACNLGFSPNSFPQLATTGVGVEKVGAAFLSFGD
jgi:hypothetical protein